MSTPMPEQLPTLGDAYRIERELGGGGMSRVFVATEVALNRRVVVKVLGRALAEGLSAERFAREIALAAALQDPHIVPVHATGTTGEGLPFFTMPFVEGESLRARMQQGPVPLEEALRILRDIAEALEYAHARGIVHRDIKPENVLLSGRSALVADFGIAKALTAARTHTAEQPVGGTLTSVGMSLGTPAYMAPEQAVGDPTDHRADLYAWGMVAYELLAGAHPFASRTSAAQLVAAQLSEMPKPLDEVRPGLPPALGALVMRCLAKTPTERPADAEAVLAALGGATSALGATSGTRAPVAAAGRGRTIGIAAAALVLALAGGAWLLGRGGDGAGTAPAAGAAAFDATPALAVLPFEHQGDTADAYITEGLSDELRGRLAGVRDLSVIARSSSVQYRGTSKSPADIAEELGVRWLLTATVQVSGSGDSRRVIVRPELVEVGADGQPRTRWGEPFDAQGADALRLQGDIAGRVVDAMQVKLAGADRARTIAVPTTDLAAYDAFMRGRAALDWGTNSSAAALDRAIPFFEEALQRDSSFLRAWIALATSRTLRVANSRTRDPEMAARALAAIERVERLAPGSPEALLTRATQVRLLDADPDSARVLFELGARLSPGDVRFASNLGILLAQDLGESEEAATYLARAVALNPRSGPSRLIHAIVLRGTGRIAEARATVERALELVPGSAPAVEAAVEVELVAGDTAAARSLLARLLPTISESGNLLQLASVYGWLLDESTSARALAIALGAVAADRGEWTLRGAELLHSRGEHARARAWGDTARRILAAEANAASAGMRIFMDLASAEALAGNADAAMNAASRARAALIAESRGRGSIYAFRTATIAAAAAVAGARDSAIAWLAEPALADIGYRGARLAVDPAFANLRDDPRFRALAEAP